MIHPSPDDVVIIGARRTPQGKLLGQLSSVGAVTLGATALKAALDSSRTQPAQIDAVVFGQVVQANTGQNPARQTAVTAGLPLECPAVTVNSVCLSGLRAIIDAARILRLGEAQVVAAGGQESMSQAPHMIPGSRTGHTYGSQHLVDSLERDALTDAFNHDSMGVNTEHGNEERGLDRASQDDIAVTSHRRAADAWKSGAFDAEICPVRVPQRKADPIIVSKDQGIRPDATTDTLSGLRPAFVPGGTITAGNASPMSDGAAAVILSTRAWAEKNNSPVLATIGGWGQIAGPDTFLHVKPAAAITHALDIAGWSVHDLDFIEINEAFASVSLASSRALGVSLDRINIHGGAIAVGHPVGASGARLVVHAAHELNHRGKGQAAVALCGGGGQGDALLLWR